MGKIQKRNFFLAIVLAIISLYLLGSLRDIRPDIPAFSNSLIELVSLHIFLISTLTFFLYQLLVLLSKPNKPTTIPLILSCVLSYILICYTINPPFLPMSNFAVSAPYIIIGDFLRDKHGINWYFMDWGGWMITLILYLFPIYTYVIYRLIKFAIHKKNQH